MGNAIEDIAAERQRQIEAEGWTPEHDDQHVSGALAQAAACYAMCAISVISKWGVFDPVIDVAHRELWPFSAQWWKPKNPRQDLVRAAALIAAEIDRLDRAEPQEAS